MDEMGEYPWAMPVKTNGPIFRFSAWLLVPPTSETKKITAFLGQFGDEEEFIAWCEGQGVKGIRANGSECLLAKAVKMATGQKVGVDHHSIVHILDKEENIMAPVNLPLALAEVPRKFDNKCWPELEANHAIHPAH